MVFERQTIIGALFSNMTSSVLENAQNFLSHQLSHLKTSSLDPICGLSRRMVHRLHKQKQHVACLTTHHHGKPLARLASVDPTPQPTWKTKSWHSAKSAQRQPHFLTCQTWTWTFKFHICKSPWNALEPFSLALSDLLTFLFCGNSYLSQRNHRTNCLIETFKRSYFKLTL